MQDNIHYSSPESQEHFWEDSITKQAWLKYSTWALTWSALQWKEIPVSFTTTAEWEVIYINWFTADSAAFSSEYAEADQLAKEYIDLPWIQDCCFEDKESVAEITAIHRLSQKFRNWWDIEQARSNKYEENEQMNRTMTDAEMLRSGLGMCSEFSSFTWWYLWWCGYSYEVVAWTMSWEPHNIIPTAIDDKQVFIDRNNIWTDEYWISYPPIYIREWNIWRHFLFPDVTIDFA
jgi:hypothetical protein